MSRKSVAISLLAATAIACAPFAAQAQGGEPASGVRLQRGAATGASAPSPGVSVKSVRGVTVYRARPAPAVVLAGGPETAPKAKAGEPCRTVIIERHYHYSRLRRLRTQGFYSGHPGKSRRFTQGFYSGPVDWGWR